MSPLHTSDRFPEQLTLPLDGASGAEAAFARVFRRFGARRPAPDFRVEFHPFAGLRSSIRMRGELCEVRITDVLEQAPPIVLEALAEILIAQVLRRRASREARECYMAYVFHPAVRRKIDAARRARGRKRMLPARGRAFDLEETFARLNRRFFHGKLARPRLGWTARASRSVLGHYDSGHGAILINRRLDSPSVPRFLVEYLVFHEMLHIRFPVERRGHRRVVHSRAFREAERKFPDYKRAREMMKKL